jgi:hypothetical protein
MKVQKFELFHGAVLTKLVRSDRPITLRMIETRPSEAWSAYTLNNEVDLYIKYNTAPRSLKRDRAGTAWTFVFGQDELGQMRRSVSKRQTYAALVCGRCNIGKDSMQVCLLYPDEIQGIIYADLRGAPGPHHQIRPEETPEGH